MYQNQQVCIPDHEGQLPKILPQPRDEMDMKKKTATLPGQAEVTRTSLSSIYKAHLLAA